MKEKTKLELLAEVGKEMSKKTKLGEKIKFFFTKGIAKKMTLSMAVIIFIIGIIGSFEGVPLDMTAFTDFIQSFGYVYIPLIISIGANASLDTWKKGKTKIEKVKGECKDVQEENPDRPR